MKLTLNQAAKESGRAKSTLMDAINSGRLSAPKDDKGRYQIDPAELFRVFEKTTPNEQSEPKPNTLSEQENRIEIARLQAELEAEKRLNESMTEQVADLRRRLDQEGEERRALTLRLTDQRPAQPARRGLFARLFGDQ